MVQSYQAKAFRIYSRQVELGLELSDIAPSDDAVNPKRICGRNTYLGMLKGNSKKSEIYKSVSEHLTLKIEDVRYAEREAVCAEDSAIIELWKKTSKVKQNVLLQALIVEFGKSVADPVLPGVVYALSTSTPENRQRIIGDLEEQFRNTEHQKHVERFLEYARLFGNAAGQVSSKKPTDHLIDNNIQLKNQSIQFLKSNPPAVGFIHTANKLVCDRTPEGIVQHIFETNGSLEKLAVLYNCVTCPRPTEGWSNICIAIRGLASAIAPICLDIHSYATVQEYICTGSSSPVDIETTKTFIAQCVVGHVTGLPVAPETNFGDPPRYRCVEGISAPCEPASTEEDEILKLFEVTLRRHVQPKGGEERHDLQAALKRKKSLDQHIYVVLFAPQQRLTPDQYETLKDPINGFPEVILLNSSVDAEPMVNAQIHDLFIEIFDYFTP